MKLVRNLRFSFKTMSPQDYLYNQRDALLTKKAHIKTLSPLQNGNQGDAFVTDAIQLVGVPKGQTYQRYKEFDTFQKLLTEHDCDLIYLQIDPSAYIARQRFMSHRCAMGEVQDYRKDGVHLIDPLTPITWEETVVNLFTVDMLRENKLPNQMNYNKGLYAYAYPQLQQAGQTKELSQLFIKQISNQILQGRRTGYNLIDKVLYAGLMGKQKVMLGGMPESLFRLILGKSVTVHEMRDIFRMVVSKNRQLTLSLSLKDATENFLPHIFLLPKDLYMTAILKESFQAAVSMFSFVGIQHWRPMQQYWIGPPTGINMTEATKIPQGFPGQTDEDLIEKQAILDVLLQTRHWSKSYLSNPFPYLFQDITKIPSQQLAYHKETFLKFYRLYSGFKNKEQKMLPHQQQILSLQDLERQQDQVINMKSTFQNSPNLSFLRAVKPPKVKPQQAKK